MADCKSRAKSEHLKPTLTPKEREACRLYSLELYSKVEAWRIGLGKRPKRKDKDGKDDSRANAWNFFNQAKVIEHCQTILSTARAEDCMKVGRTMRQLEDFIQNSADAENWTAVSSMMDKKLKVMGLMRDRVVVSHEATMDDDTLVEALAGDDPKKQALLRALLGKDGFKKETEH